MEPTATVPPVSNRRWRRGESRQRLLDTALVAIAGAGPSGVSGRKIAQGAGVKHPQIQQMFGSVDALMEASLLTERDRFIAEVLDASEGFPDPFAIADYPHFWRAIAQVVLDPGPIELERLAAGGPIQHFEALLASKVSDSSQDDPDERVALASAWFAAPLGFLVFEDTYRRDLELTPEDLDQCATRIKQRLTELANGAALPEARSEQSGVAATERPSASAQGRELLVWAARDLLATRLETSVRGRELADHAGVNHGLISHYFGSKAAVFDEALIELHSELVGEAVGQVGGLHSAGGPDIFTRHRAFIRAWASRLIGGRATPDFELLGLRALIETTQDRRGSGADRLEVMGDALAAMSLGLGWAVLGPLPTAGDRAENEAITSQIHRLHYWLLDG